MNCIIFNPIIIILFIHLFVVMGQETITLSTPQFDADNIGKGMMTSYPLPLLLEGYKAKEIAAGGYQSALISDKGELYYWGLVGPTVLTSPKKAQFPTDDSALLSETETQFVNITQVDLGGYHTMALDGNGRLYTWGRGINGVLGHGDMADKETPQLVTALAKRKVKMIAAGYSHSVAVTDAGIYTWGSGKRGQLGNGGVKDHNSPKVIKTKGMPIKHITGVCAGGHHTVLLNDEGEVFAFGANQYGTLGLGSTKDVLSPAKVAELKGIFITKISCGGDHMLALSKDGRVFGWGWGEKGQLGTGSQEDGLVPVEIDLKNKLDEGDFVTSISAGAYATSFIVTDKGKLFAFGMGESGILGNGRNDDVLSPIEVNIVDDVQLVDVGYKHSLIVTKNNEVYVFGENTFGQLGIDNTAEGEDITPTGSAGVSSPFQSTTTTTLSEPTPSA